VDCGPGDQCKDNICDEDNDKCKAVPKAASTPCQDGLYCTSFGGKPGDADHCDGYGNCVGDPVDCSGLDGGCRFGVCDEKTDSCIVKELKGCFSETAFGICAGQCDDGEGGYIGTCKRLNSAKGITANRWGWYDTAGGTCFDMYAGVGQNDMENKGCFVGTAFLGDESCPENQQTLYWKDYTVCFLPAEGFTAAGVHVHIGGDLPKTENGKYTVAPGQYTPGEGDYVIVHMDVYGPYSDSQYCESGCVDSSCPARRHLLRGPLDE
jgi:hypothetical protein